MVMIPDIQLSVEEDIIDEIQEYEGKPSHYCM